MSGQYPARIRKLPEYEGRFEAYKLEAKGADVLLASYPAGTHISEHSHETDNHGVIIRGQLNLTMDGLETVVKAGQWYHVPAHRPHSARFEMDTDEIEFWFEPNRV